ncbi:MAG: phosphoribosylaminoimidazolesuccinocarboxamide synthase [Candidatus ainarchaeum sp.]|nr:phosphoribosylaminoimidazolesuccinocarboxamide synthase [Candidatus ainarchaeum sp.]MDD5096480.1 phosphoribosylaminoimidazolesuccinocarboxamide synthase [Candidatus ainarchaeum sp.]
METITRTDLDLPLIHRGKVRDVYSFGENILMVATDRVSAFDVVFNEGVPYKGTVLNSLSAFWFKKTEEIIDNHMVTAEIPEGLPPYLSGRSMVVKKADPLKIEAVVRGYLTGSGWKDYQKDGKVGGVQLPEGLRNGSKLPEPIFSPSTKAEHGHDQNITFEEVKEMLGHEAAAYVRDKAIELYGFGHEHLSKCGFVLADTKFEFGVFGEEIILIDECMTPDSSRYWDKTEYDKGKLVSSDKQYLRDYLETLDWNKTPPPPPIPKEVIGNLSNKYLDAYARITGHKLI